MYSRVISEANLLAVCTNNVAGRAWIPCFCHYVEIFRSHSLTLLLFFLFWVICDNPYNFGIISSSRIFFKHFYGIYSISFQITCWKSSILDNKTQDIVFQKTTCRIIITILQSKHYILCFVSLSIKNRPLYLVLKSLTKNLFSDILRK